ncbi:ABC transporter permease DevC [Nostoc sp.]|uniref:ABC transporter permease DevC n=1 Tax=Nostoc sp. TaxID=1180 RepID=UPI002FF67DDD
MARKTSLAWLQLTRKKMRLFVALAGIGFADILMFMQMGFNESLFESAVSFYKNLDGDIALINPRSTSVVDMKTFSQRTLYKSLGLNGVKSVNPVYFGFTSWRNLQNRQVHNIFIVGVNPNNNVLKIPDIEHNIDKISLLDVVLFDRGSRKEFGDIVDDFNQGKQITTEVGNRRVKVGGVFELGTSFAINGTIATSDLTFLRIFKNRQSGLIDIGMISLEPGADKKIVLEQLRKYLPKSVKVLSKEELFEFEKDYWHSSTPLGFIFGLGIAIGFFVGTVIVYQILYTEVSDHLPEYATLKAMGYTNNYLLFVILREALILAILGYIPGFGFAIFQYNLARQITLLPMIMTIDIASKVLILTVLMCSISGAIAVRKLQSADPADIF